MDDKSSSKRNYLHLKLFVHFALFCVERLQYSSYYFTIFTASSRNKDNKSSDSSSSSKPRKRPIRNVSTPTNVSPVKKPRPNLTGHQGRDYDLNEIRSELKGLHSVKQEPEETINKQESIDTETNTLTNPQGTSTAPEPPQVDKQAEDVYEFKEPEPFELELHDEKKKRTHRIFDDISPSKYTSTLSKSLSEEISEDPLRPRASLHSPSLSPFRDFVTTREAGRQSPEDDSKDGLFSLDDDSFPGDGSLGPTFEGFTPAKNQETYSKKSKVSKLRELIDDSPDSPADDEQSSEDEPEDILSKEEEEVVIIEPASGTENIEPAKAPEPELKEIPKMHIENSNVIAEKEKIIEEKSETLEEPKKEMIESKENSKSAPPQITLEIQSQIKEETPLPKNIEIPTQMKVEIPAQNKVEIPIQNKSDTSTQKKFEIIPQKEIELTPQNKTDLASQKKGEITPQKKVEIPVLKKVEINIQKKVETLVPKKLDLPQKIDLAPLKTTETVIPKKVEIPKALSPAAAVSTSSIKEVLPNTKDIEEIKKEEVPKPSIIALTLEEVKENTLKSKIDKKIDSEPSISKLEPPSSPLIDTEEDKSEPDSPARIDVIPEPPPAFLLQSEGPKIAEKLLKAISSAKRLSMSPPPSEELPNTPKTDALKPTRPESKLASVSPEPRSLPSKTEIVKPSIKIDFIKKPAPLESVDSIFGEPSNLTDAKRDPLDIRKVKPCEATPPRLQSPLSILERRKSVADLPLVAPGKSNKVLNDTIQKLSSQINQAAAAVATVTPVPVLPSVPLLSFPAEERSESSDSDDADRR